jgi:hypothetical protein
MKELYEALAKAKAEFKPLIKDANNPFFKSKYITLDGIIGAIDEALLKNGLTYRHIVQDEQMQCVIHHKSGSELVAASIPFLTINDPQKMGAVITYQRRYTLEMAMGVAGELDDDANSVSHATTGQTYTSTSRKNYTVTEAQIKRLFAIQKNSGKSVDDVRSFIKEKFNHDSSDQLTKKEYDTVCNWLEGK